MKRLALVAIALAMACGGGQSHVKLFQTDWEDDQGTSIEAVRDAATDAYGLTAGPALARAEELPEGEPGDIPPAEFAEPQDFDDVPPPEDGA